jgi:hypothetical protein
MKKAVLTFEDGKAELWCELRVDLSVVYQFVPLKTADQKAKEAASLLCGKGPVLHTTHRKE